MAQRPTPHELYSMMAKYRQHRLAVYHPDGDTAKCQVAGCHNRRYWLSDRQKYATVCSRRCEAKLPGQAGESQFASLLLSKSRL